MKRAEFRSQFGSSTAVILPVIHVIDADQTIKNMTVARNGGCKGVFLINHDFGIDEFLPIIKTAREAFPDFWIGINFLAVTGKDAFPILADLEKGGYRIDGYWGDDARIDEHAGPDQQHEAAEILATKTRVSWHGLYFGGTAFKKQREVDPVNYPVAARIACGFMDVVTTSGVATGHAADLSKIETFRNSCGEMPIALASGITPENVHSYAGQVDCLMVATGINIAGDFYNIDPERLALLKHNLGNET